MDNKLLSDLQRFAEEHNVSVKDIVLEVKHKEKVHNETEMAEKVKANEQLVGKCFYKTIEPRHSMFPAMKRFYKVISNRSENEYRVECLVFDEHPTYWFKYQAHKIGFSGDFYLGSFEFEAFRTESKMAKDFVNITEISEEEFNEHAREYLNELLETKWIPDHYRYGGKLPTDPDWPQEEKQPISLRESSE